MPPDQPAAIAEARAAVVRYGMKLVADHLVVGAAGNISIRIEIGRAHV